MTAPPSPAALAELDAVGTAEAVRSRRLTARGAVEAALGRIGKRDGALNSFTTVLTDAARRDADAVDARVARGENAGPLAGVPFAVKNLFDVKGLTTLAGSRINAERAAAARDAAPVAALRRAGAVLVGTLNMDEYAFGFTTENSHYGPTRNPHDRERVAGGSSGGSGAAVGAGLVPLALGSDTNGSIRVPAALCGVFGLKPTYGRVSRAGTALFAGSFDHVGPLARSARDLAAALDALQGPDAADPVASRRPAEPSRRTLASGIAGIRFAVADGHFAHGGEPAALAAVTTVANALGARGAVTIPEAHRARAAAMIITSAEGAELHLPDLRTRPDEFDPLTRDRFLAGALIPATAYVAAQRFRAWYRARVAALFDQIDVMLAPTTPYPAPRIGQDRITVAGVEVPMRSTLGLYTQPLSFIGLPVITVPLARRSGLPLGVQLVGAPFRESLLLRTAHYLESAGVVAAPIAQGESR